MARLWPAYLMRHGPFLVHLVFSNEKAWVYATLKEGLNTAEVTIV